MILRLGAIFIFPGTLGYLVALILVHWPWGPPIFPFMAPAAVPWAIAKLVTGWWAMVIGVGLIVAGVWYGCAESRTDR